MKRVVKRFLVFAVVLVSVMTLSAEWKVGDFVDDFGDSTGKTFLYYIPEDGYMSNTATRLSEAKVKIILGIEDSGQLTFRIDCHDYSWSNPVDSNILDDYGQWKFKNEKDETISFTLSSYSWYRFSPAKSAELLKFILSSSKIKGYCSLGRSSYGFSFETSNLAALLEEQLQARGITPEQVEAIMSGEANTGSLAFDKSLYVSLKSYGIGFSSLSNDSSTSLGFTYGMSCELDYYFGSNGITGAWGFYTDLDSFVYDFQLGYAYRYNMTSNIYMGLRAAGIFRIRTTDFYPEHSRYPQRNTALGLGLRGALEFGFQVEDNMYVVAGIADQYGFNPFSETYPGMAGSSNTFEIVLGMTMAFI